MTQRNEKKKKKKKKKQKKKQTVLKKMFIRVNTYTHTYKNLVTIILSSLILLIQNTNSHREGPSEWFIIWECDVEHTVISIDTEEILANSVDRDQTVKFSTCLLFLPEYCHTAGSYNQLKLLAKGIPTFRMHTTKIRI